MMKPKGRKITPTHAKKTPVKARAAERLAKRPKPPAQDYWNLRLYVAGQTPRSLTAFANLKRLCEEYLAGRYQIEVIDLLKAPQLAQGDQIVALPTLIRKLPEPIKRIIGDLSNIERVMVDMDLQPRRANHANASGR